MNAATCRLADGPPPLWDDALAFLSQGLLSLVQGTASPRVKEEDSALIERAQRGDRQAFSLLFHRYVEEVHRRLTRLIGPDPEREDLVQEVFLAAFRGLEHFRGEAAFSTWLHSILVHVAYTHLRRRNRRPLDLRDEEEIERALQSQSPADNLAERRQQVKDALVLLDGIKPKKRIAFVLRVVEGLSLEEIGVLVNAKPAAVGQRVKYAQRELHRLAARREQHASASRSA